MLWEGKDKAEEALWHRRAARAPACKAAMRLCGRGGNRGASSTEHSQGREESRHARADCEKNSNKPTKQHLREHTRHTAHFTSCLLRTRCLYKV